MKEHEKPLSVEKQIDNLKEMGLIIEDEEYAKNLLNKVSYYRFIKGYSKRLKENGKYRNGIAFSEIERLYNFNTELRYLIFREIEKVEIGLRCALTNFISMRYGSFGYLKKENFREEKYFNEFQREIENEIKRNQNNPFVKNFKENYEGHLLPFYAVAELMSFGCTSKLYKNMLEVDQKEIADFYNINYLYLQSWFEHLSYVRNICAHYGRLYDNNMTKKPMLYKKYKKIGISNAKVFSTILCLKIFLSENDQWKDFVFQLESLLEQYKIEKEAIGISTEKWKDILLSEKR